MDLTEYVKALEGRDSQTRGEQVLTALRTLGIEPSVQKCRWPQLRNIIVDFSPNLEVRRLLFSAHYDVAKGSPGSNDNASGVAVLLGLCDRLRHVPASVRVVFFDREEAWLRTPIFRLGLLGSLYYVCRTNLRNTAAIYNLEFCGSGDFLGIWPVRDKRGNLPAVKAVTEAAARLRLPSKLAHIPWLFLTSDHLPFRLRGIADALTLSLLPASQALVLENLLAGLSIPRLLVGQRQALPEPLSLIHTAKDTSSRVNEDSLRLMLSLLVEMIQNYGQTDKLSPRDKEKP